MTPTLHPRASLPRPATVVATRSPTRHARRLGAALLVVATGAAASAAGPPTPSESATRATPAGAAAPQGTITPLLMPSGVLVFVDPVTGRILERPRAEQLAALGGLRVAQAASRGAERDRAIAALPRFAVPGGYGLHVEGWFLSSTVVERDAAGSLSFRCLDPDHPEHLPGAAAHREGPAPVGAPAPATAPVQ